MRRKHFVSIGCAVASILYMVVAFMNTPVAQSESSCSGDINNPVLNISSPTSAEHFTTDSPTVDVSGYAFEPCGLTMIQWESSSSSGDVVSGTTSDWVNWVWHIAAIPLEEGENVISVYATDVAGNKGSVSLGVTYVPVQPPPTPPPGECLSLDNKKAKFTFYFGGPDYDDLDRGSEVGYLEKDPEAGFSMPFEQDVTVRIDFAGVVDPAFVGTIPAGTVSGTTKYRYTSSGPGIREIVFQDATSTSVYFYVFVDKVNFVPGIKASMSEQEYLAFVKKISSYTVTVIIGDDKIWCGTSPLKSGTYDSHKIELVFNR